MVLDALRHPLEADGRKTKVTEGGQLRIDAFAAARHRETFDSVFTDLGMPHIDDRTVAAAIKLASPATPFVLFTDWEHRLRMKRELPSM